MQVNIAVRHGELSADAHDRVIEKAQTLPKYYDRITALYVTVDLARELSPSVEIRATAEHTEDFVAVAEAPSVAAALDSVLDKVREQLRRYKDKSRDHHATALKHLPDPAAEEGAQG